MIISKNKLKNMNKYEKRAKEILQYMDLQLAKKYINTKIAHWTNSEFEHVREEGESKEYWEIVLSYIT